MTVLGNLLNSNHSYEINTDMGKITVHANSRAGASKIAKAAGYVVRDVNMIG